MQESKPRKCGRYKHDVYSVKGNLGNVDYTRCLVFRKSEGCRRHTSRQKVLETYEGMPILDQTPFKSIAKFDAQKNK